MTEIKNAKITKTTLGHEDHGILTFYIHLDYGGSGQGFGGYALDSPIKINGKFSHREGTKYGMVLVKKILDTLKIKRWEDLVGQNIRVKADFSDISAISHFLDDTWFDIRKDMEKFNER